ncbi:hypothetical protein [Flavisolibacter tropicus]|uniref:DUF4468 domain-containing protein n=1 Tax=Flavisolibacter tropicus TaxID=1492898 RepID=A0A172TQC7_9BACT|nr:hypothetical protein [Flavisolibacter tropicus]ANE49271.1 hypothetical protein SY85_00885 [Flavisolibacter tropicus]
MPKLILFVLLFTAFFQGQAQLSKRETIVYIDKKMKEAEGHYRYLEHDSKNVKMVFSNHAFGVSSGKEAIVVVNYTRKPDDSELESDDSKYSFNPAYISSIVPVKSSSDPVGILFIYLTGKVGIRSVRYSGGEVVNESTDTIRVPFLQADATNFNKLKNAFEHLKKIYKAEMDADPFAN